MAYVLRLRAAFLRADGLLFNADWIAQGIEYGRGKMRRSDFGSAGLTFVFNAGLLCNKFHNIGCVVRVKQERVSRKDI